MESHRRGMLQIVTMKGFILMTFLVMAIRCDLFSDAGDTLGDHEHQFSVDTVGADIDLAQCQLRCLLSARSSPSWPLWTPRADQDNTNGLHNCAQDRACSSGSDQCCQICESVHRTAKQDDRLCHSSNEGNAVRTMLTERHLTDGVELTWTLPPPSESNENQKPLLYTVHWRTSFWPTRNLEKADWELLASTTNRQLSVDGLTRGRLHQFQVATIDINGCRARSNISLPFVLSKQPAKPGAPTNLTEGETVISDGQIAIDFHWSPPSWSDIPVNRYKIFWSIKWPTESPPGGMSAAHEYRQVVPSSVRSYRLENLEPNHEYIVQVQAICQLGETKLKSNRSTMFVQTPSLSHSLQPEIPGEDEKYVRADQLERESRDLWTLLSSEPYFNNGLLKSNVTWIRNDVTIDLETMGPGPFLYTVNWTSIDHCSTSIEAGTSLPTSSPTRRGLARSLSTTTRGNEVTIYDLLFNCRYLVQLLISAARSRDVTRVVSHVILTTPECRRVTVVGDVTPDCASAEERDDRTVLGTPNEPSNVRYVFTITATNITARISWNPTLVDGIAVTQSPAPASQVTGYHVTWSRAEPLHWYATDLTTSVSKMLAPNITAISIGGLAEATTYVVRVAATSSAGIGRSAVIKFTTPRLQRQELQQLQPSREAMDEHGEFTQHDLARQYPSTADGRTTPPSGVNIGRRLGVHRGRDGDVETIPWPSYRPRSVHREQSLVDGGPRHERLPVQHVRMPTSTSSYGASFSYQYGGRRTNTRLTMTTVAFTSRTRVVGRTKKPAQVDRPAPVVIDPTTRYRLTAASAQPRTGSSTSGRISTNGCLAIITVMIVLRVT